MLWCYLALGKGLRVLDGVIITCYEVVKVLKACSRCGKIHEYGACKVPASGYRVYTRKTATSITRFRSSRVWQRKRLEILERDQHLCKLCLYRGVINNKALEVHHIVPIKDNEELKLEDSNLVTVCSTCHSLVEDDKSYIGLLQRLASIPPGKII